MNSQTIPTKQGQVCKITNPLPDENPAETYLITEDVSVYSDDATIYVVSLTDLQRNISNPAFAPRKAITKSELTIVAFEQPIGKLDVKTDTIVAYVVGHFFSFGFSADLNPWFILFGRVFYRIMYQIHPYLV